MTGCLSKNVGKMSFLDNSTVLLRYLDGWLEHKEKRGKYRPYWFVLKGKVDSSNHLVKAFLFCFKDQNTHVEAHFVGSHEISFPGAYVTLSKARNQKPSKFDFTICFNNTKFNFRASDSITQARWIYALCDLVGGRFPPSELPAENNNIRHGSYTPKRAARTLSAISNVLHTQSSLSESTPSQVTLRGQSVDGGTFGGPLLQPKNKKPLQLQRSKNVTSTAPLCPLATWYYPSMSRVVAETVLFKETVGSYLLRDSESFAGNYTLTFKDVDKVKNHMILPTSYNSYKFEDPEIGHTFKTAEDAVLFYMGLKKTAKFIPKPCVYSCGDDVAIGNSYDPDSYLQAEEINAESLQVSKSPTSLQQEPFKAQSRKASLPAIKLPPRNLTRTTSTPTTSSPSSFDFPTSDANQDGMYIKLDSNDGYLDVSNASLGCNDVFDQSTISLEDSSISNFASRSNSQRVNPLKLSSSSNPNEELARRRSSNPHKHAFVHLNTNNDSYLVMGPGDKVIDNDSKPPEAPERTLNPPQAVNDDSLYLDTSEIKDEVPTNKRSNSQRVNPLKLSPSSKPNEELARRRSSNPHKHAYVNLNTNNDSYLVMGPGDKVIDNDSKRPEAPERTLNPPQAVDDDPLYLESVEMSTTVQTNSSGGGSQRVNPLKLSPSSNPNEELARRGSSNPHKHAYVNLNTNNDSYLVMGPGDKVIDNDSKPPEAPERTLNPPQAADDDPLYLESSDIPVSMPVGKSYTDKRRNPLQKKYSPHHVPPSTLSAASRYMNLNTKVTAYADQPLPALPTSNQTSHQRKLVQQKEVVEDFDYALDPGKLGSAPPALPPRSAMPRRLSHH